MKKLALFSFLFLLLLVSFFYFHKLVVKNDWDKESRCVEVVCENCSECLQKKSNPNESPAFLIDDQDDGALVKGKLVNSFSGLSSKEVGVCLCDDFCQTMSKEVDLLPVSHAIKNVVNSCKQKKDFVDDDLKKLILMSSVNDAVDTEVGVDSFEAANLVKNNDKYWVLFLGKLYNHSLVEFPEKKWIINASFHASIESEAFDGCGNVVPLSSFLFGKNIKLKDIFLLSFLSDNRKLFSYRTIAIGPRPGNSREEQYLAYLANFDIKIEAERKEKRVDVGAIYRFKLSSCDRVKCSFGFNLPIKNVSHKMNMGFFATDPKSLGFNKGDLRLILNDVDFQDSFSNSFIDVKDFFDQVVLSPKSLFFREMQNKVGVGDISLFLLFDLVELFDRVNGFQIGADIVFPSGKRPCADEVWDVALGLGAFQFGLTANFLFKTSVPYFNPSAAIAGRFHFGFDELRRIPKLKGHSENRRVRVRDVDDLLAEVFDVYFLDPFEEFDSCVKHFADQVVCSETKLGNILEFSLGNYFYNVFRESFRLSFFYDFVYKGKDKVCVKCDKGTFNTELLECDTRMRTHQISWNLAYVSKKGIEVNVGSKHILGGKNYPKRHSIFASIVAAF